MRNYIFLLNFIVLTACGMDEQITEKQHNNKIGLSLASAVDLCQKLGEIGSVNGYSAKELNFFCADGQLSKLQNSSPNVVVLENKEAKISQISIASYMKMKGQLSQAKSMAKMYCQDFDVYKSYYPNEVYARVQDIPTWNLTNNGCDFEFIGKKILFFQPRYKGKTEMHEFDGGYINNTYLTQKVSLVHRATSLSIVQQEGEYLHVWNITSSSAESKGFHDTVVSEMKNSSLLSLEGFADTLD